MTKMDAKKISEDALVNAVLPALNWDPLARLGLPHDKKGLLRAKRMLHPDVSKHKQATEAYMMLDSLFNAPDIDLRIAQGSYVDGGVRWSFDSVNQDLAQRAIRFQKSIHSATDDVKWVPRVDNQDDSNYTSTYNLGSDEGSWVMLSEFDGLDSRTVAWVVRRLLAVATVSYNQNIIHGDINKYVVALAPKVHGLRLDGWWSAVKSGEHLVVSPKQETLRRYLSGSNADDLLMVSHIARTLTDCWNKPTGELGSLLKEWTLRPVELEQAVRMTESALDSNFGKRVWHELSAPEGAHLM